MVIKLSYFQNINWLLIFDLHLKLKSFFYYLWSITKTYSFISTVKYENKTVQVNEEVPGKDFAKGTYFVNVFDKNAELVSKTSFELK